MKFNNYLNSQFEEIAQDSRLRAYGALLSLTHLWTFLNWNLGNFFINSLSNNTNTMCYPFFSFCDWFRFSSPLLYVFLYLYLALALVSIALFIKKETSLLACKIFFVLFIYKLIFYYSYYGFSDGIQLVTNLIIFIFLFLPDKQRATKFTLIAVYITAGAIKLNTHWLTGSTIQGTSFLVGDKLLIALFYVVIVEMILIFGLLSRQKWVRWFVLLNLFSLHFFSAFVVGYLNTLFMWSLLGLLVVDEIFGIENNKPQKSTIIFVSVFALTQIFPHLLFKRPDLGGASKLPLLNFYERDIECQPILIAQGQGHSQQLSLIGTQSKNPTYCDPLSYLNTARRLCHKNQRKKSFDRLSFSIVTKRYLESEFTPIYSSPDVCKSSLILWSEWTHIGSWK